MKTSYNATKKALLLAYSIHGSGIDCNYELSQNNTSVILCNSFHCMDDFGGYDGYMDFIVRINKKTLVTSISFLQPDAKMYRKYGKQLKEYLEDVFCNSDLLPLENYKRPYYLTILHF
jgi:hypothetical protein